jgi:RNA polymerase sigma factor (sigma-70 family)
MSAGQKRSSSSKISGLDAPIRRSSTMGIRSEQEINRRNQCTIENLPLVNKLARCVARHLPSYIELDDLKQDGAIGLMRAVERFSDVYGVPLEVFAAKRIKGAMLDAISGRNRDRAKNLDSVGGRHELASSWQSSTKIELTVDWNTVQKALQEALARLTAQEAAIINMRYREEESLKEIGLALHISVKITSLVHRAALRRMRETLKAYGIGGPIPISEFVDRMPMSVARQGRKWN